MSASKPRPIQTVSRDLREIPDEAEPSYSYEDNAYLGGLEDDVEDEFHRRLAVASKPPSMVGGSSFWRTDVPTLPTQPVTLKERKSSGGLLGAALQLHSQSDTASGSATKERKVSVADARPASVNRTLPDFRRSGTNGSMGADRNIPVVSPQLRDAKKNTSKQRAEARRLKLDSQLHEVDIGHVVEVPAAAEPTKTPSSREVGGDTFLEDAIGAYTSSLLASKDGAESLASNDSSDTGGPSTTTRSTSASTAAGLFYPGTNKAAAKNTGGVLFGKSSSLIFPTGVEPPTNPDGTTDSTALKRHRINILLDQCETVRFPFKKKLSLNAMGLKATDIPIKDLYGTNLGNTLHKLSLAGNRLSTIPPKLATCLPALKTLDLSQCELHQLPERWNLPQLKRLNLSHNQLTDFPEEPMLEGLPELTELNMYGNKVRVIVVPNNPKLLSKLETLNLGYNDLSYIPEELDRLKSLRVLKVMNNFLEKIPMRVCDMDLKTIDVSSNPVIQPPIETCERGICSMKRYYHCLRMEEQSKQKALEALQSKASRQPKKPAKGKKMFNLSKPNRIMQISLGRKYSDDSSSQTSSSFLMPDASQSVTSELTTDIASSPTEIDSTKRSLSVNIPPTHDEAATSRSAAFSLNTREDVRRAKSLDIKPTIRFAEDTSFEPTKMPPTPELEISSPAVDEDLKDLSENLDEVTVNDTLKVIFVGMAMAGKTSMIKRLIEGENAVVPKRDERTVGVDIYEWDPKDDRRFEHIDSRIDFQDKELEELCGEVNVKFSVWDFAGQHVYHATHELFFSPRALYVLVWDMGATNPATKVRKQDFETQLGAFSLNYNSDDDSDDDDDFTMEEETIRAERALKRDIDDKIQFWVDCIQSSAPGAAILPVASFDDLFASNPQEAKRRCSFLKQRLLEHEARRIQGIKERLNAYVAENKANDDAALRLRKLLCSYTRPKLIFGKSEDDAIIRVSGTKYTGFAELTERIINIATGRERAQHPYPIFRGHVGARIPRMRLEVREAVRRMRDRFKVVEWGYFIKQLRENGLTNVEDISDALHFLTNIGELSYFGGVNPGRGQTISDLNDEWAKDSRRASMSLMGPADDVSAMSEDEDLEDETEEDTTLQLDSTSMTLPTTETGSFATLDETLAGGLSQYVFLNPRWLVAAVACILRHDLDREIQETRRALAHGHKFIKRGDSFYEANLNCPVITADDACMLWQAKKFTKKAAERLEEYSNDMPVKPFEFLQLLLIRFGVFVPIDLSIEKAFLGGKEYARRLTNEEEMPDEITIGQSNSILKATFFFLPSLLGPGEPTEAWTYKNTDSWKATLCHSVLFPDGVPPGLMERITASVLSSIYAIAHRQEQPTYRTIDGSHVPAYEGQLTVKEVLCWRTAFLVKVGMQLTDENKESIVEVFCGLVDKDSHLCVGSDSMLSGMRRLVTSGKGQEGDGGRKIWKGGYLIVLKAVQKVMDEYGGLEYEKQGFCPDCLAKKAVAEASYWDFAYIRGVIKNGEGFIRCHHGHRIDTRLIAGPLDSMAAKPHPGIGPGSQEPIVPINDLLRAVVVVGLWDGHSKSRKVIRVGSGFIADKKRGLIVTASHTLMNIWGDKSSPFGENYYGLRNGKVVIGIIPRTKGEETGTEAVFRYFAKIVAKDPLIEKGICQLDACILKITTRMENDVLGNGEGCGDEPERLLLNDPIALKQEKLHQLKITDKCELDEQVRIIGYNQGGEGLLGPGVSLNRFIDFARGYVCKKFAAGEGATDDQVRHRFKPREEIVVICPTIGGHSGGPCVNQQGEVIGILSRADPAENQRCYLVPTYEWKALLKEAKNSL